MPWALALAGGEYAALVLIKDGAIDPVATASAAALLLSAELAYWSLGPQVASDEPSLARRRVGLVATACLASAAVGMITLSASQLSVRGSLLLDLVGVGAAVGVLALLAYLARMHAES